MADTSIYKGGPAVQLMNPLTTMGQVGNIIQQRNQNQLFQQDFAAKQGLARAYGGAVDPTTGQLDTNKLLSNVARDPDVAWKSGEIAQQALAREKDQIGIAKDKYDLLTKHYTTVNNYLGTLVNDPQLNPTTVAGTLGKMAADGLITPEQAAKELQTMPSGPNGTAADPKTLRNWALQYQLRGMDAKSRLDAIAGQTQVLNTGGQQQVVSVSPINGVNQLGTFTNTMTPGEASTPTNMLVRNPDGTMSPSTVPRSQYAAMAKQGPIAVEPPLTAAGLNPGQANEMVELFDPRTQQKVLVPKGLIAAGGGAPAAGVPSAAGAGGMGLPAGPPLGRQEAAAVTGQESAKQGIQLQNTADQVPSRKAALQNMETALQGFTPGRTADWKLLGKQLMDELTPFNVNKKSIASQEEFTKIASQIAIQQLGQLGSGTDEKLAAAAKANPSALLSKMGNQEIIRMLKGNEDALAVKNQEWQKYREANGPDSYGKFSTEFNKVYDPRVFNSSYMTVPEFQKYVKSLPTKEREVFKSAYNTAVDNGWITEHGK